MIFTVLIRKYKSFRKTFCANNASVLRTAEGGRQYRVRLKDLIRRGDVSANIEMRPGDVVIIPQSWF